MQRKATQLADGIRELTAPGSVALSATRTGRRSPTAFTLVELLVVIAIIEALAALLMPALRHQRGQLAAELLREASQLQRSEQTITLKSTLS